VSDWLCESVAISEGITAHAMYSRTKERGTEFAEKHQIPNVYTDMEEFLSSDIDAVYVASPNFLHFAQAKAAIEHGKHVLVEKPACLSEVEFCELEELAKARGVIILEAMRPGHDTAVDAVRGAMKEIGVIRRSVFDFCQYSSRYDKFKNGEVLNAFNPAMGNAALMDIGVYALHCCVMLFGEPKTVYSKSVILHNGMEGMGSVFLDYGTHQAEVVYSKITDSYTPSIITGEDGTITITKLSLFEKVCLHKRGGEDTILVDGRTENNMIYEIADFVRAIRGEMSVDSFNEVTRITLRIMDTIRDQNGIVFPSEK
jgi:predicted dehydrogenase